MSQAQDVSFVKFIYILFAMVTPLPAEPPQNKQTEYNKYIKLDMAERLCTKCSTGAIEDEQHFLMQCSKFNEFRNTFFKIINDSNKILWNVLLDSDR